MHRLMQRLRLLRPFRKKNDSSDSCIRWDGRTNEPTRAHLFNLLLINFLVPLLHVIFLKDLHEDPKARTRFVAVTTILIEV